MSEIVQVCDAHFAKLEAQLKAETKERKEESNELRQKISKEAQGLLIRCNMIENRAKEERRLSEIASSNAKERHEALRVEVETLEALLCDNHMTKDPFKHFGERSQISPSPTHIGGKDRTVASMSPAMASTQCGSR